jgi:hypothetical protein
MVVEYGFSDSSTGMHTYQSILQVGVHYTASFGCSIISISPGVAVEYRRVNI